MAIHIGTGVAIPLGVCTFGFRQGTEVQLRREIRIYMIVLVEGIRFRMTLSAIEAQGRIRNMGLMCPNSPDCRFAIAVYVLGRRGI